MTRDDFVSWLDADDQLGHVLEASDTPVAYGEVWIDADAHDLELAHLVVAPEQRGRGLGRQLVDRLYECAQEIAPWPVYIRVAPENTVALACYRGAAFKPVGCPGPETDQRWTWLLRHGG